MLDKAWSLLGVLSVIYGLMVAFGPRDPQFRRPFTLIGSVVLLVIFVPVALFQVYAWVTQ